MPRLSYTARARADLLDVWVVIAADDPVAADRILDRLAKRVQVLTQWPLIGVACPHIASDARMLIERPYLVLYRVLSDDVQVVRVLHGARDVDGALFGEGIE